MDTEDIAVQYITGQVKQASIADCGRWTTDFTQAGPRRTCLN
jgi:hypothetical protein